MESFSRHSRDIPVDLRSTDLEGLKAELSMHLARAMARQSPVKVYNKFKIPGGFGGVISPDETIQASFPISLAGSIQDIFTYLNIESKDVLVSIKIDSPEGSYQFELPLKKGFQSSPKISNVTSPSVILIKICNKGKELVEASVGFTFEEVR